MEKVYLEYDIMPQSGKSKGYMYKHNKYISNWLITFFLEICDRRTTINNPKLKMEGRPLISKQDWGLESCRTNDCIHGNIP